MTVQKSSSIEEIEEEEKVLKEHHSNNDRDQEIRDMQMCIFPERHYYYHLKNAMEA
jgi:hypothetical protein